VVGNTSYVALFHCMTFKNRSKVLVLSYKKKVCTFIRFTLVFIYIFLTNCHPTTACLSQCLRDDGCYCTTSHRYMESELKFPCNTKYCDKGHPSVQNWTCLCSSLGFWPILEGLKKIILKKRTIISKFLLKGVGNNFNNPSILFLSLKIYTYFCTRSK